MSKTMALTPRISEKAYALSQSSGVYVFGVPRNANKLTVAQAVTDQFEVGVVTVKYENVIGKIKHV